MTLSLSGVVRNHYNGIPSSFSVIHDVLSRAKYDVGDQTYRTAGGVSSLRLLSALEQTRPPLDLVWVDVDDNGLPLNPKWRYQVVTGSIPDPAQICGSALTNACTSQLPSTNVPGSGSLTDTICSHGSNTFGIDGHMDWFPATYEGPISWEGHSNSVYDDDDYEIRLAPLESAGLTTASNKTIELEFSSDETIDHFKTPWWDSFHRAVDQNAAAAHQMIDGRDAIVTGLYGLDCAHNASAELHPVWAMAIRVENVFPNQRWAIFVRNWGNEGFCSSRQRLWDVRSYTFRLGWLAGASSIGVLNSTFLTNSSQVSGPNVQFATNEGILVTFTLPQPEAQAQVNGELTLQGQFPPGAQEQPEALQTLGSPTAQEDQVNFKERIFAALLTQMSSTQREAFFAQFPPKSPSEDAIVLPQVRAIQVSHLPARVVTSQFPNVRSVLNQQKVERDQHVEGALRLAFGGQIPEVQ